MEKGKPGLAVIIASKPKGNMKEPKEDKDKMYGDMGKEILQAIKENKPSSLVSYLKDLIKYCQNEE